MNKKLLKLIIDTKENTKDYTEFFPLLINEINLMIKNNDSNEFIRNSKEMEIWEKISNAQISENPKTAYPKELFYKDILELL
jgi:hypothetical protein